MGWQFLSFSSVFKNHYWYVIINWSPLFFQISFVFMWYPSSVAGLHPGYHLNILWSWLLRLLRLFKVSQTLLAFYDWQIWGIWYSGEHPSVVMWLIILFKIRFRLWVFWGKDHRSNVPFSSHHIKIHTINMIYHCWCWPWSSGYVFSKFLHCKVTLHHILLHSESRRKSPCTSHTLVGGNVPSRC